jgi:Ser/Thr protein kinase RdoA (MazF antagonist)
MLESRTFTEAPPPVSEAEAAALALRHWGITGQARAQDGESDLNFRIATGAAGDFVLKVQHPADPLADLLAQNAALDHLAAVDPSFPVPRVCRPLLPYPPQGDGVVRVELGAGPQSLRLLTWVPGVPLAELRPFSRPLLRSFGAALARLDRGLATYAGPPTEPDLLWDLQRAARLRPLLPGIADPRVRALAAHALDRFAAEVEPGLAALPHQVIHNDANPANVLARAEVPDEIGGVFDFGDLTFAPRVQELAVAASYVYSRSEDPAGDVACLSAAYQAGLPLEAAELELLPALIAARCAMSCCIGAWRAGLFPDNAPYLTRSIAIMGEALERLAVESKALERLAVESTALERLAIAERAPEHA